MGPFLVKVDLHVAGGRMDFRPSLVVVVVVVALIVVPVLAFVVAVDLPVLVRPSVAVAEAFAAEGRFAGQVEVVPFELDQQGTDYNLIPENE